MVGRRTVAIASLPIANTTSVQPAFVELLPRLGGIAPLKKDRNFPPKSGSFWMECLQLI